MIRNTINENKNKTISWLELSIKTKPKKILNSTRWWVDDIDKLNYMLTIKNIEKLTQYGAVGDWRVGKVVTLDSSYLIQLYKHNRRETKQVNIERTPIGEGDTALYELWLWEDDSGNAKPIRRLLRKCDFELGPSYVIKNIENMMTLK